MYILKYDISVKALVISKGFYWLHTGNLNSFKLSIIRNLRLDL